MLLCIYIANSFHIFNNINIQYSMYNYLLLTFYGIINVEKWMNIWQVKITYLLDIAFAKSKTKH